MTTVRTERGDTSVTLDAAARNTGVVFVCAHGAGGHMNDRSMTALGAALRLRGMTVARFNFFYREKKSGRPDPMPVLLECFTAVVDHVRTTLQPRVLVIGGRSMGGRAASMLAADGFACDGLLLLAYPLHPPGQTQKLRVAHLPAIRVPVLCFNGTRDPFSESDLMNAAVGPLAPRWTMHWLSGADHSLHVLKKSGTTSEAVLEEVATTAEQWVSKL